MKIEKRSFNLTEVEVRNEDDKPKITGYAAEFEKLSHPLWGFREKIRKGTFQRSISDPNANIKALWNHNTDFVLGSTRNGSLKLWEDDRGLKFELEPPNTQWGKDALESIRRGDVDGVSFGFAVKTDEWDETEEGTIRTLIDVDLYEISPTPFPAYPQTSVSARSIFNEIGIDFDSLSNVLTRAEHGLKLTDSDKDQIRSVIDVLNQYTKEKEQPDLSMYKKKLQLLEVE